MDRFIVALSFQFWYSWHGSFWGFGCTSVRILFQSRFRTWRLPDSSRVIVWSVVCFFFVVLWLLSRGDVAEKDRTLSPHNTRKDSTMLHQSSSRSCLLTHPTIHPPLQLFTSQHKGICATYERHFSYWCCFPRMWNPFLFPVPDHGFTPIRIPILCLPNETAH